MSDNERKTVVFINLTHQRAMDLAEKAQLAKHAGDEEEARQLFRQAFMFESMAANATPDGDAAEPSRSILYRSAAALALDCADDEVLEERREPMALASEWPTEELLDHYCDLRESDVRDLHQPEDAHPSTRHSLMLSGFLAKTDEGWKLTKYGQEVLGRAEAIMAGEWMPTPPVMIFPPGHRFKVGVGKKWGLYSNHLKTLRYLAQFPDSTWRTLKVVFGTKEMLYLKEQGLAIGEPLKGSPWRISASGLEALRKALSLSDK